MLVKMQHQRYENQVLQKILSPQTMEKQSIGYWGSNQKSQEPYFSISGQS